MHIHHHHHHASFTIVIRLIVKLFIFSIIDKLFMFRFIVKLFISRFIVKLFIFRSTLHDADCRSAGVPDVPARHHQCHPQQPAQADSPSGEVANTETDKQKDKYKYKFQTNTKTNLRQIQDNTFLNSHLKLTFQVER